MSAAPVAIDPVDAEELAEMLELVADLCDHQHDLMSRALCRFTGYGYDVDDLRADAKRLGRRLDRVMR